MKEYYVVEYSEWSKQNGKYPFHFGSLKKAIDGNIRDMRHNNR